MKSGELDYAAGLTSLYGQFDTFFQKWIPIVKGKNSHH